MNTLEKSTVTYVDHMGNDDSVVNAARVSFANDASNYTEAQNDSLIAYLARGMSSKQHDHLMNKLSKATTKEERADIVRQLNAPLHWTPFAHTAITLRCSAPVPIRTQCFKHAVGLIANEESRRYITSEPEVIFPQFRAQAESVKQGSSDELHKDNDYFREMYINHCKVSLMIYKRMLSRGVCPEQARFVLPQGTIVNWVWTGNLYSLYNFWLKRSDPHAQKEIRDMADQVGEILEKLYPRSWAALTSL